MGCAHVCSNLAILMRRSTFSGTLGWTQIPFGSPHRWRRRGGVPWVNNLEIDISSRFCLLKSFEVYFLPPLIFVHISCIFTLLLSMPLVGRWKIGFPLHLAKGVGIERGIHPKSWCGISHREKTVHLRLRPPWSEAKPHDCGNLWRHHQEVQR